MSAKVTVLLPNIEGSPQPYTRITLLADNFEQRSDRITVKNGNTVVGSFTEDAQVYLAGSESGFPS